ncbi:hypothetical protein D3C86_1936240 [compost metagenome]
METGSVGLAVWAWLMVETPVNAAPSSRADAIAVSFLGITFMVKLLEIVFLIRGPEGGLMVL